MGNAPTTGGDETDDEWTPTSTSNAGWRTRARGWVTRACLVVASAVFALYVVGLVVPDEEEDGAREDACRAMMRTRWVRRRCRRRRA